MERDVSEETMRDVAHTPPAGESVTNVWQRGDLESAPTANTPADD